MCPKSILDVPVNGLSMRPLLPHGSTAVVSPCDAAELRVGDIALFRSRKALVVHRVVGLDSGPDGLRIAERGDWAASPRWRPAWHVVGRVVAVKLRHGCLELDRPLVKRLLVFSGLATSLRDAPTIVKRVATCVISVLLALVAAFSVTHRVDRSSKGSL
jgi:hypothetical protein